MPQESSFRHLKITQFAIQEIFPKPSNYRKIRQNWGHSVKNLSLKKYLFFQSTSQVITPHQAPQIMTWFLALIPVCLALRVWLTSLAFVPVPWPDDSAFYFVAKEFFKWPPRWVMIPQAPFEPTYRIFNFNTMPLYPLLLGLGRWIGIDGSFLIKLWPLGAWALSGSLLVIALRKNGLPALLTLCIALAIGLDPELRWASVLVRPESLIGLCGMALVLGLTLGFPKRFHPRGFWDPVSALLAISAYAHFNAIHLLFPVIFAYAFQPKRLFQIGWKTAFYLSPWVLVVLSQWNLFIHQMTLQWSRLSVPNEWLKSVKRAIEGLFEQMGNPIPWDGVIHYAAIGIWIIILIGIFRSFYLLLDPLVRKLISKQRFSPPWPKPTQNELFLLPAAGWIIGSIWLCQSKPEVWFLYYVHISVWCFSGLALLQLWRQAQQSRLLKRSHLFSRLALGASTSLLVSILSIFTYVDLKQAIQLQNTVSWHWPTYYSFVDCVDEQLTELEKKRPPHPDRPFQVWSPTFPDITIELSRRHPHWELTRTNDFWDRAPLAIEHGRRVDAVVVPETINWEERDVSGKPENHPEMRSAWMYWRGYFLSQLLDIPGWKPNRWVCQKGRWQAYIYMEEPHR
jgi:hypothetical protein